MYACRVTSDLIRIAQAASPLNRYGPIRCPTLGHNLRFKRGNNSKISKQIVNAPWYVTNDTLHHDLNVPYVRDEIKKSDIQIGETPQHISDWRRNRNAD